ncbi:MAG: DinB family protein [Leptospiraceae bacterium]|nr:DinB family protein [Leptospiraceae bacterium]
MEIKYPTECVDSKEVFSMWKQFRKEVIECLKKTPVSEFTKSPEEGRWSISEVGEHLYLTQWNIARSVPIILSGRGNALFNGYSQEPDYRMIKVTLMKPSGVKHPPSVAPLSKYSFEELLPLLMKAETKLEETLLKNTKENLMKYKMEHPYFGDLHIFDFIWVMGMHENSHLAALKKRTTEF